MLTSRKAGRRMRNVSIDRRVEDSKDYLLEELEEFLRMPSVSAQGGDEGSFRGCAEWVRAKLEEVGAEAKLMETEGHPVVFAEMGGAGDGDKGDVMARIQALRVYQEERGPLPFKLKFIIEGEEEVGSPNLPAFVRRNEELLAADACLWEGSMKDESGRPMIFCGTKGLLYVELRAKGASHDLHSMYGGLAPNPAWRLVQALRTIKDENGEITLDGLEELIEPPSKEDLEAIEEIPFDEAALKESWGVKGFDRGLIGKEALKEYLLRPTANIAGIQSGYTGPGSKTIVPSEAFVKMDFRLVAGQSPGPVLELIRSHLRKRNFHDIEVVDLHGVEAAKTPVDSPIVRTAVETWRDLGREDAVVFPTIGGVGGAPPL